jgi:uncharacterized damage-inducible protein DinB
MSDSRYPIGKYETRPFDQKLKVEWIRDIQFLPRNLENAVLNLDATQLDTPYREGGWTVKQLVHHVADSHVNAYIRFKLGLTEDNPTIKPYQEALWAELSDTRNLPINISLTLLHSLHLRWIEILKNMKDEEWSRTVFHPESKKELSLWYLLGLYAWHSRHHTAHVTALRERMKW